MSRSNMTRNQRYVYNTVSIHIIPFVSVDFFFNSVLRPFQDYFSSYETGQSVGGAKTGEP